MQELSNMIADKYEEVIEKIKSFSNEYLNEEYNDICVRAAETLFLNNEDQLKKGKSFSWAAGIVHAIGTINGLFDSKEEPYIKALDLYKEFGVSSSTGLSKFKEVRKLLDISEDCTKWMLKLGQGKTSADKEVAATLEKKVDNEEGTEDLKEETFKFLVDKRFVMAQRIANHAWTQKNYKNRAKFANEALDIYEDCADAYIILSRNSSLNDIQRKELLERAVNAGKNVLKIDRLENAPSEVLKLRVAEPFFGAKYTLANHLWKMGEREAAIENIYDIVNYIPKDNLMARGVLANWLLIENRFDELESFLDKHENDFLAAINYSRVALLYKTNKVNDAEHALRRAYRRNPFVIPYILKQKKAANSLSNKIKFGSEEEAMQYANLGLDAWNDFGLIQWIKEKKRDFDILDGK